MEQRSSSSPERNEKKTVLEIDLAAYNDVARMLEETLSVTAVKEFEDQIQQFVTDGLKEVGLLRNDVVLGTAGDNAILIFDHAETMHVFSETVQHATMSYNSDKTFESAKRWFRMGAATGIVQALPSERRVVGTTIARAVRLEAVADRGQLVIDLPTFESLPQELRTVYGDEEVLTREA